MKGKDLNSRFRTRNGRATIATSIVPARSLSRSKGVISSTIVTRACGYLREKEPSTDGRKYGPMVGITPTQSGPPTDVFRSTTSLRAASTSRRTARARGRNALPSSVKRTVRPRRSKSRTPNSFSSFRICCERDGCETCDCCAARLKLPVSAMAQK